MQEEAETPHFPVASEMEINILMHREVHFGGSFKVMLEYYEREGKGVNPEFSFTKILELSALENSLEKNLAPLLLTGAHAEKVARAREAYQKLRDLYEKRGASAKIPLLLADLILSEEEHPALEIEAIVALKSAVVPSLLQLMQSEDFHDPLFPGYGLAPAHAVKCLGLIGDKHAVIALFEAIGSEDFFNEDLILEALQAIGAPAKEFLLTVVKGKPYNEDNVKAAIGLLKFKDEPGVAETTLELLKEPAVRNLVPLAHYLSYVCEGLQGKAARHKFLELSADPATPKFLAREMHTIAKTWQASAPSSAADN